MPQFAAKMLTHEGIVRKKNEDFIDMVPEKNFYVLSDGMGGHNAGEIASAYIVNTIIKEFSKTKLSSDEENIFNFFKQSIRKANALVFEHSKNNPETKGMGGTVCVFYLKEDYYYLAWAGDSRIYRISGGKIELLTEDHSYVWQLYKSGSISFSEMSSHPMKNVILRAVGSSENVEVDCKSGEFSQGDTFLLCSDGLNNEIQDNDILRIISSEKDLSLAAEKLIENANENGGADNISVIIINTGIVI